MSDWLDQFMTTRLRRRRAPAAVDLVELVNSAEGRAAAAIMRTVQAIAFRRPADDLGFREAGHDGEWPRGGYITEASLDRPRMQKEKSRVGFAQDQDRRRAELDAADAALAADAPESAPEMEAAPPLDIDEIMAEMGEPNGPS